MYRTVLRAVPTATLPRAASKTAGKRFITTAPPHKTSRSWKNSAARWGLAGTLVYYYNTAVVFAEEPEYVAHAPPEAPREDETYATLDTIAEQRRAQARSQIASSPPTNAPTAANPSDAPPATQPEGLEEEASQEGAFNEETGEINWDCPCLGGMAHGPCGEEFRNAFSCFVFSKEEPKGVDCIENFKAMQTCFRQHPDIYGAELDDEELEPPPQETTDAIARNDPSRGEKVEVHTRDSAAPSASEAEEKRQRAKAATQQVQQDHDDEKAKSETDEAVPKAWHDATSAKPTEK
ncbi:hypothetical protein MBLNU230_g5051t1 [Neophaeotheca triangularis]